MIQEAYCSYEIAKLLKEKGFNEPCFYYYKDKVLMFSPILKGRNSYQTDTYSAPTHQMAMKWLRIEHNILLFLLPAQENGKLVYLVKVWTWNEEEGIYESTYAPMPRKEPEQAIEAALKYSLKNLV